MAKQNVELALGAIDVFNRRDLDGFLALMAEDGEIHSRLVAMEGGYRGLDGARRWWRDLLEFIPDYMVEPVGEVRAIGDATLAQLRARGHGAASTAPLDETFWQLVRWRDGKCVWWCNYMTEAEAIEAAEGG
jgi:ketosteroid isomerase-like protein